MSTNLAAKTTKSIEYANRPAQVSAASERIAPKGSNAIILYDFIRDARADNDRTDGGILIPKTTTPQRDEACWATVVAAGPGSYLDKWISQEAGSSRLGSSVFVESELKPGMRVLVQGPLCGDAVVIDGLEHRIVHDSVVIGVDEDAN